MSEAIGSDFDFSKSIFDQMMDLFVRPEVMRRQKNKTVEEPFLLNQAQVVFYPDGRPTQVRLNDEINIVATITYRDGFVPKQGTPVKVGDIEEIEGVGLCDGEDSDAGHITMIPFARGWHICFDFRYNRALAGMHLANAEEFLASAKGALEKGHLAPLVDNLFSACELAAKASLLAHPDVKFREKTTHKAIKARYNLAANIGNAEKEHSRILNKLSALRGSARYLNSESNINFEEGQALVDGVADMIQTTKHFFGENTV